MYDLFSKMQPRVPFNMSIKQMLVLRALMTSSGVKASIVERFSSNNGRLIGEKAADEIADRLTGFIKHIGQEPIERKTLVHGEVIRQAKKLTMYENTLAQNFIVWNRTKAPYEIW